MSPINKETVDRKLILLDEVLEKLQDIKALSQENFMSDFFIHDTAIRNLVLGIEIVTDIGNHILLEVFHSSADTYKDVVLTLGEAEVVPKEFAKENAQMADFRNLIIHAYGSLDMKQVYQNLQKAPDVFREFAKCYVEFLEKNE